MDGLKQIMYGVTDFARMRRENAYFVDRTGLIRELEKTSYAMFLRPRRFGKSLWCSILQAYYDVDYAAKFDEFFGGLDIGRNPTPDLMDRADYISEIMNRRHPYQKGVAAREDIEL